MAVELVAGAVIFLVMVIILLVLKIKNLKKMIEETLFDKKSMSVKYGKMSEQFFPFMKSYPYDAQNFRFLGTPIDGIQFEKDKIIFVEFKTGSSSFSPKQKDIKRLVENKKVEFEEVRIE